MPSTSPFTTLPSKNGLFYCYILRFDFLALSLSQFYYIVVCIILCHFRFVTIRNEGAETIWPSHLSVQNQLLLLRHFSFQCIFSTTMTFCRFYKTFEFEHSLCQFLVSRNTLSSSQRYQKWHSRAYCEYMERIQYTYTDTMIELGERKIIYFSNLWLALFSSHTVCSIVQCVNRMTTEMSNDSVVCATKRYARQAIE